MAKKPKGFGQPIQSHPKKSSKKKPPKSIVLHLAPLKDTELIDDKEARLQLIFSNHGAIPTVSDQSLKHYHQYIQANFPTNILLRCEEPFDWEAPYIYGRGVSEAHQQQRIQHPSYLDRYQLKALSNIIQKPYGILVDVVRIVDDKAFRLPLLNFSPEDNESIQGQTSISDYVFWWWHYQPTFP